MSEPNLILVAGALLAAGVVASLLAGRVRVPGARPVPRPRHGGRQRRLGCIDFDDYEPRAPIGIVALALILFEGGLAAAGGRSGPVLAPVVASRSWGRS